MIEKYSHKLIYYLQIETINKGSVNGSMQLSEKYVIFKGERLNLAKLN
jgi:hypothetical protein